MQGVLTNTNVMIMVFDEEEVHPSLYLIVWTALSLNSSAFLRPSSAVNWLLHGLNERVSLKNWEVTYRFVVPKHSKARLLLKRKQNRNKHLKEIFQ